MALFVGRLPNDLRTRELEEIFEKYGRITRCDIKRGGYGFVEFEDPRDAEDAIKKCDGMRVFGGRIVVEYARGARQGREGAREGPRGECFKCGKEGHYARDCPLMGGSDPAYGDRRDDRRDDRRGDYSSRDHDRYERSGGDYGRDYDRYERRRDYRGRSRSPRRPEPDTAANDSGMIVDKQGYPTKPEKRINYF